MEWTNNPNNGYYWTKVPKHSATLEIVRVFGKHYCCIASAHNREVDGKHIFFGPIPRPPQVEPLPNPLRNYFGDGEEDDAPPPDEQECHCDTCTSMTSHKHH